MTTPLGKLIRDHVAKRDRVNLLVEAEKQRKAGQAKHALLMRDVDRWNETYAEDARYFLQLEKRSG